MFSITSVKKLKTNMNCTSLCSSYWGGAFYNAIFQTMEEEDLLWAKRITDEYRSIRKYFSENFYNHASCDFDDTSWAIWQYHNPETQEGIVMAFRRCNSPFDTVNIDLKGMPKDKVYSFRNLDNGDVIESNGELKICLYEKRSSVIYEYKLR